MLVRVDRSVVVHSLRLFGAELAEVTEAFAAPVHAPDFKSQSAPLDLTSLSGSCKRAWHGPNVRHMPVKCTAWRGVGHTLVTPPGPRTAHLSIQSALNVDQGWNATYSRRVDYRKIITIEPGKRGGKPCIRGLRITVYDVLEYLASGMSEAEILRDFPDLTREDIRACLAFAADRERKFVSTSPE